MWISIASVVFAVGAVLIPVMGLAQRLKANKGIGWQFIRFTVIATALPITAALALNDLLSGEAATIIGGAMGYAFGRGDGGNGGSQQT